MRLDNYVTFKHDEISRSRAKSLIETGNVRVNGKIVYKPSYVVDEFSDVLLEVMTEALPYVSRGGLKLRSAIEEFGIDPTNKICIDVGASTGGFTDCLLKHGANKIFAVDSGSNQLAGVLREDKRVVSIEHFNARFLTLETIGELCSLAVADLSFISQTLVLPSIFSVLEENGDYIGLIKPQFECGKSALNKNGIVKDKKEYYHAIKRVLDSAEECGFEIKGIISSPITGGDGNREFLFHAMKSAFPIKGNIADQTIKNLIANS